MAVDLVELSPSRRTRDGESRLLVKLGHHSGTYLIDGPACGGFPDSLRKGVLFFLYAEKLFHHCLLVAKQGINLGVALPTCCVGLRVIDGELQG